LISPETITLVRDRTDIVAVISESVPSLKKRGRAFVGLCPFHKEKTPSFHVNPDRNHFYCFGCKEHGSAIDFLIKHEGYTFPEAVRALAERAGIDVKEEDRAHTSADAERLERQKRAREDLYAVNALAAQYFEAELRKNEHRPYALEELARRGLEPGKSAEVDEALQAFRIGYAPAAWDGLASFLRAQGVSPVAACDVGLLVPRSSGSGYYDRFRHRLMFAVVDPQGRVVAFSGRALRDLPATDADANANRRNSDDGPPPKYINSPESLVYTKGQMLFGIHQARHAIRHEEVAVLVEGNFDVVALHARGVGNVVAPLGTAFTVEQAKLLKRFAPSVVFLFDGDAAGRGAVRKSREAIRESGLSARVADLPDGVDPDEVARDKGAQRVKEIVAAAKGMLEALIDMELDEAFVSADAYERAARVSVVAKLLTDEDDPLVRAMAKSYADQLAGRLDLARSPESFRALEQTVKQALARAEAERRAAARQAPPPSGARIAPRTPGAAERAAIMGALIEWPALLEDRDVQEELSVLSGPSVTVVAALRRCARERVAGPRAGDGDGAGGVYDRAGGRTIDADAFLSQIPESSHAFVNKHLADPEHDDIRAAKEYLLENAKKLKRLLLSQEAAQIARETYRAQGDWDTEKELLREAADRLRAKRGL
jgi:DNA primase